MGGKFETDAKKKKRWPWVLCVSMILLAGVLLVMYFNKNREATIFGVPTLTVQTPQKLSASQTEDFTLDVLIDHLGETHYPAMSMCVSFDASRLEFLDVKEGNIFILSDENSVGQKLPAWNYNVQNSNDTGLINIMYLDMTGGRNAFSQELLADNYNVVLRLKFRLRGSVRPGDVLDLIVEDAVFAASDENQSLAMTTSTLRIKNGKIVIGE